MGRGVVGLVLATLVTVVICGATFQYEDEYESEPAPVPFVKKVVVQPTYHLGFKIHHRAFSYQGIGYKLGCGKTRFLSLWRRYYKRYGSRSKCFSKLRKLHLIRRQVSTTHSTSTTDSRISYMTYYKKWHGLKLIHGFVYNGIAYRLSCRLQKFYRLWGACYNNYHNVGQCVSSLLHNKLFVVYPGFIGGHVSTVHSGPGFGRISYNVYLSKYHGFKLRHRRFSYRGKSYVLRCRRRKFYSVWRRYYRKYHAVGPVFSHLFGKKLFVMYRGGVRHTSRQISYNVYLNRYHGFRLRHRRFVYLGKSYVLRCQRRKFYSLWRHYYRKYHAVGRVFSHLLGKKLFVVYRRGGRRTSTRVTYNVYLNRYHGFKLRHRRFTYHGKSYVLKCQRRKFYSVWRHYYRKYHAVGRVFSHLLGKNLFVVYRRGGRRVSTRVTYNAYINRYHGFKLRHRRFTYHGKSYVLRCRRRKFYSLWSHYYRKYHAVGPVFGRLFRNKTFVVYHGGSVGIHKKLSYMDYFRKFHGVKISGHKFIYNGKAYRLKIGRQKFYSLWRHYYRKFHNVRSCFRRLYKRRVFVIGTTSSRINYVSYYKSHHGFKMTGKRLFYNGNAYVLKIRRNKFYRIWYRYYNRYHSSRKIFDALCRKRFIVRYGGDEINYVSYYNTHHGWKLNGKRFTYNGDAYVLQAPRSKFYKLWYKFYRKYHDIDEIFGRLYDMHLFAPFSGAVVAGPDFGELDEYLDKHKMIADSHVARVNKAANKHVRRITNVSNQHIKQINRQSNQHVSRINGEANKHMNRFKQLVDHHIKKLEEKRKRHLNDVEKQHRRHMQQREIQHKKHVSVKQSVNTRHEKFIARAAAHFSDIDYLNTYHGFKIIDNRFNFDGTDFQLKCSRERWYTKWCTCYEKEHNVNTCLDSLYNQGLVVTAGGEEAPVTVQNQEAQSEKSQNQDVQTDKAQIQEAQTENAQNQEAQTEKTQNDKPAPAVEPEFVEEY